MIRSWFLVFSLVTCTYANAEFVTWDFQAIYDGSSPAPPNALPGTGVAPGQAAQGHYTFFIPSPNATVYPFANSSWRINGDIHPTVAYDSTPEMISLTGSVGVNNGTSPGQHDNLFFTSDNSGISPSLRCPYQLVGEVTGGPYTLWNTLVPPVSPPSLAWFQSSRIRIPVRYVDAFSSRLVCDQVSFSLTSLTRRESPYRVLQVLWTV
jgi:hypothetical protein